MQDLKWFASFTKRALGSRDMKAIELDAEALGISSVQLMENAGAAVARFIDKKFAKSKKILILCGTGNNGGDGFTTARHLENKHEVTVAILGNREEIRSLPSILNLRAIEGSKFIDIIYNAYSEAGALVKKSDVIIDAVFGTGFHGDLPDNIKKIARIVERSNKPVVAVDLPSGVDADGGASKNAFKANYTITFHKPKIGLLNYAYAGTVEVADIGICAEAELYTGPGELQKAATPRRKAGNKYSNGRILIVSGNAEYSGAPSLAADAAYNTLASLRIGSGYAVLLVPERIKDIARQTSPNLIVKSMGISRIGEGSADLAYAELEKADAIAIGPGIGKDADTLDVAAKIIRKAMSLKKKVVIDADAIDAVSMLGVLNSNIAITPHDGEFESLYGIKPGEKLKERASAAIMLAKKLNANVVLKGHTTIITNGHFLRINEAKTSALATMGSGDVLTGIIAGYAATGTDIFDACAAGVYLHSHIGDSLAMEKGLHILATDVVERIPYIMKSFDKEVS
ncbi:MAG: NAD(P)H-hydrate dehydratase [Candidatus Micrarchaeaceae archaeon]